MKQGIHPKTYKDAKIKDNSSGAVFTVLSTVKEMSVEISSLTHPFYTGKQRIVDSDDLVKKFEERKQKVNTKAIKQKKEKKVKRRRSKVQSLEKKEKVTLKDMLKDFK
ncbi:MAG: 50S ribosomal protein L31 [Candidatus Dojkabacteria bacterium]